MQTDYQESKQIPDLESATTAVATDLLVIDKVIGNFSTKKITFSDFKASLNIPSAISDIADLQSELDSKANSSQVLTDVPANALFSDTTYSVGDGGLTQKNFTTALKTAFDNLSNRITVNNTSGIDVGKDTDAKSHFGRMAIYSPYTDHIGFAHVDRATNTGYVFLADTYNNVYINSNSVMRFERNGVEIARFATGYGYFGINNNNPQERLSVVGNIAVTGTVDGVDIATLATDVSNKEDSFTKNTAFNKNFGSTIGTVCQGNDSRLSNARQCDNTFADASTSRTALGLATVASTGNYSDLNDAPDAYTLPLASSSVRGGIKIGYTESNKNYPVELADEKAFVNVPWVDTTYNVEDGGLTEKNFTTSLFNKLIGIDDSATANSTDSHLLNRTNHIGEQAISTITNLQTSLNAKANSSQVLTDVPANAVFTDTTYSVGDGGLTQKNFTTALKTALDNLSSRISVNNTSGIDVGKDTDAKSHFGRMAIYSPYTDHIGFAHVDRATNTGYVFLADTYNNVYLNSNGLMKFERNGAEIARFANSSGYMGINNNNPQERLSVGGNIAVSGTVDGVDIATLKSDFDNLDDAIQELEQRVSNLE